MPDKFPYFRWFPSDAEGDNLYASLSFAEVGLFHKLLNKAWPNGGIPADPQEIAKILGRDAAEVAELWPRVKRCFVQKRNKNLQMVNPRQERERKHVMERSKQARTSALKRHSNNSNLQANAVPTQEPCERTANALRTLCERTARASDSDSVSVSEVVVVEDSKKGKIQTLKRFDEEFWPLYPRKVARKAAKLAFEKATRTSTCEEICAGLRAHLPDMAAKELRFVPHPATWLNQERWKDPLESVGGPVERRVVLCEHCDDTGKLNSEELPDPTENPCAFAEAMKPCPHCRQGSELARLRESWLAGSWEQPSGAGVGR